GEPPAAASARRSCSSATSTAIAARLAAKPSELASICDAISATSALLVAAAPDRGVTMTPCAREVNAPYVPSHRCEGGATALSHLPDCAGTRWRGSRSCWDRPEGRQHGGYSRRNSHEKNLAGDGCSGRPGGGHDCSLRPGRRRRWRRRRWCWRCRHG